MSAPVMIFRRASRRRNIRLNITSFVWFLFSGSFISLVVTCAYVTIYLEDDPDDRDYLFEFPDVEDKTEIEDKILLGDDVHDDLNLVSSKLIDSSQIELAGWWMPHVRWNPEIDCNTGQPGICSKVSAKLIDSSQIELAGWWMPHVRWNPEIDCNTGQPGICSKVSSKLID
ncbi:uncharacterized protein [Amphiura filiformis]|uniref:uncharacterized protein n=1 Tax=Amphiura filiformis TaxID=82378 RepID=UPI003B210753